MKIAIITGINGQDGSYLSELLFDKRYKVYGIVRRGSTFTTERIDDKRHNYTLFYGDLGDLSCLMHIFNKLREDILVAECCEVYNLAAQSHVKISFEIPEYTSDIDGLGVLRILEAIRNCGLTEKVRFYQASTSELYGKVLEIPQNEDTPFYPRSPYGVAKLYAYWIVNNYREAYGMYACNGILFNHESPRRGENFVTRKITQGVANIIKGKTEFITLGNLSAQRDWGHAKDYVYAMWLMLQQEISEDLVISSQETHPVREFVEIAFKQVHLDITWSGYNENEVGTDQYGNIRVKIDAKYYRPTEVDILLGDSSRARKKLGWKPQYSFHDLICEMIQNDLGNP